MGALLLPSFLQLTLQLPHLLQQHCVVALKGLEDVHEKMQLGLGTGPCSKLRLPGQKEQPLTDTALQGLLALKRRWQASKQHVDLGIPPLAVAESAGWNARPQGQPTN